MKKIAALLLSAGVLTGLIALLVVVFPSESSATAKKNFCNSLSDLSSTVMSYEGLDPTTATNDELESAADDISAAYNDVVDEANDWANAYDNPLAEAHNDLYWAIDDLPGDYTVAQSLDSLDDELDAFPQAFQETFDGSGCSYS